jgi:hypothetical protein
MLSFSPRAEARRVEKHGQLVVAAHVCESCDRVGFPEVGLSL